MQLHYTHDTLPAAGQTIEVAPGVLWLRMPLPFVLDHINLWLLQDGAAWVAVDTGIAVDAVRNAWRQVLAGRRLERQIVTHFHPDHLGLAAWLEQETGAPLWITHGEYTAAQLVTHQIAGYGVPAMVDMFRAHGLDEAALTALSERGNSYVRGVPALPATIRRIFAGEDIVIDGHTWTVIPGFGHSAEHASLYCAAQGILISGDMLLPRISTNVSAFAAVPEADPLGSFLDSIDRFKVLPEDTLVLPSHGKPFRGLHDRVAQLHAHHQERFQLLVAACAATPKSAAELITVLFERAITDIHQTMFAMGEAIAHLIYLEKTRQLQRVVENGITRFVKIH